MIGESDLSDLYDSGEVYSGESLSVSLLLSLRSLAFFYSTTYF